MNTFIHCDRGAFTLDEARDILSEGKRLGLTVRAHAEQIAHTGCAKLVAELGGTSADHLERVDRSGLEAMAQQQTVAVLLPGAQMYLKDSAPPIGLMRDTGVKMAIATDLNPGSSPVHDLWTCATLGCVLQGLTIEEAALGITRHAGLAMGRPELGWLGMSSNSSNSRAATAGSRSRTGQGSAADMALFRVAPGDPPTVESLIQNIGGT